MEGFSEIRVPDGASTAAAIAKSAALRQLGGEYAWETTYERTWEAVVEDEATGLLKTDVFAQRKAAQRQEQVLAKVQRGMLRNLFVIVDLSRGMEHTDFKPTRARAVVDVAKDFVREYFDSNPISQLGVIVTRHAVADKVSELSSNPRKHADALTEAASNGIGGDMTIQGALQVAARTLSLIPPYGTKEVVMIHGSLSSRDAGDISRTIADLQALKVRVSFISLPGEVYLAARIAQDTGGTYGVPETLEALRSQMLSHCSPPPRAVEDVRNPGDEASRAPMTRIGFPELVQEQEGICACHRTLRGRGYICPQCQTRCCEVPSKCLVCDLHLVSAPALARSYHHLFPVPVFTEVPSATEPGVRWLPQADAAAASAGSSASASASASASGSGSGGGGATDTKGPDAMVADDVDANDDEDDEVARLKRPHVLVRDASAQCGACFFALPPTGRRFVCPACSLAVCLDCDTLIHESIHTCPGCAGT